MTSSHTAFPVLRQKATPVADIGNDIKRLADDMIETMYAHSGLGLAAEQIGKDQVDLRHRYSSREGD